MKKETLEVIARIMESLGVNYELMEWKSEPVYPYFVGEYSETESQTEDGEQETSFTLTGFSRSKWLELVEIKEKIEEYFSQGHTEITSSGIGVAIFYATSYPVGTGDPELKKIEINLTIKEWKVN